MVPSLQVLGFLTFYYSYTATAQFNHSIQLYLLLMFMLLYQYYKKIKLWLNNTHNRAIFWSANRDFFGSSPAQFGSANDSYVIYCTDTYSTVF